jgi:deoxyribodipyrimidine photo-lyase
VPEGIPSLPLEALNLLPGKAWDEGFYQTWRVGENAAQQRLNAFLRTSVGDYPAQRDRPDMTATSRLSPHLHFGEIGPRQIFHGVQAHMLDPGLAGNSSGAEAYLRQLGWREFAHHLLYHFPETIESPLNSRFADFPWRRDYRLQLMAWQRGDTGYPIVDAGMRELWRTGWMHNRARMIVGSLLTKNLLIPWQEGARWFWDTLVDADLANNTLGWQWIAGCGADAAPYFRIFNPVRQAERFDPEGRYVRHWVPALARLPDKYLQQPWRAPAAVFAASGVESGSAYPEPIVDLRSSRARALQAYEQIKHEKAHRA